MLLILMHSQAWEQNPRGGIMESVSEKLPGAASLGAHIQEGVRSRPPVPRELEVDQVFMTAH